MPGGQSKEEKTGNKSTGLTDSRVGLTGAPIGLTSAKTGLTGVSSKPGSSSKNAKNKASPKFEELLVKYEKKEAAQKQKTWLNKVKNAKPSLGRRE